jgi:hypothetical protein
LVPTTRWRLRRPRSIYGYVDPSGGARDSFAIAVAHRDGGGVVVDCVRETRPPFLPEQVIAECAVLLKSYHCTKVVGDRYGGEFPREQFQKRGIRYEVSAKVKSELYVDFLPLLNSGSVMLPRSDRLVAQLASLEPPPPAARARIRSTIRATSMMI